MNILTNLGQLKHVWNERIAQMPNNGANDEAESAAGKKSRQLPEPGVSDEVDELLNEGEKEANEKEDAVGVQDDVLDEIVQSLDESEKTDEPVSEKLQVSLV